MQIKEEDAKALQDHADKVLEYAKKLTAVVQRVRRGQKLRNRTK